MQKYNHSASPCCCYQMSDPNLNNTAQILTSVDVTWVPGVSIIVKVGKDKFSSASYLILIYVIKTFPSSIYR